MSVADPACWRCRTAWCEQFTFDWCEQFMFNYDKIRPEWKIHQEENVRAALLAILTEQQRQDYVTRSTFTVHGSANGTYQISHGHTGNIYRMPYGPSLCAHPPMQGMPTEAALIGQVLMIRTDELGFLRVANTDGF